MGDVRFEFVIFVVYFGLLGGFIVVVGISVIVFFKFVEVIIDGEL